MLAQIRPLQLIFQRASIWLNDLAYSVTDEHKKEVIEYPDDEETFLRYEGDTRDGKPWGNGTMQYKSGETYTGQVLTGPML